MTTVVAVVSDLMFLSRLEAQARALGHEVNVVSSDKELRDALAGAALAVVDLHIQGVDWREAVPLAKAAGARVLAFGRHTEAALLREARAAGCDRVVARSTFVEELPQLLHELAGARRA